MPSSFGFSPVRSGSAGGAVPSAGQGRSTSRGAEHSPERWHKRTFDLFTRHLVTPITNPPSVHPSNTVRIRDDDERELEQWVYTWHVPGPAWDGERVVWEPTPPDGRLELNAQLTALRAERDEQALNQRARVRHAG
ncbi:hypothetical protein SHL15_9149 [Streptomyces hygroscopicus subsp. limoneus]|nr:hypothetical protein SHL15_9149 [Streptomyces hygroscopicus subsp. limoneus]